METTVRVARLSELTEGVPVAAHVEGVELVVLKCAGQVAIFHGICPHQGTLLAGGTVDQGVLVCSGHGWRFHGATGQNVEARRSALTRFAAVVTGDEVGVQREEVQAWKQRTSAHGSPPVSRAAGRPLTTLPGPKGLPLLGNLLQLDVTQLHLVLERWANTYGPLYRFRMATRPVVAIAEPALIHEVLRHRPETYRRLGSIAPVLMEMGINGVFSAEGEHWSRQRRVAMQALNTQHLRHFFPTLTMVTARLKARWDRAAATGQVVDVQKDLMRYTVDVTTNLAFGYDLNTLEDTGDVLQQHLEHILPMLNRRVNAPWPYWHVVKLPADRALDKALAAIRQAIAEFIAQSRARLAQDPALAAHPSNFLEAMLAARDEEGAFTEDEIVGNVLTMLVAGEDTTANTMAWMIHFMTEYPTLQDTMQQDVDAVLGDASMLQQFQDHDRLTYVEAMAHETMRLKPVAPVLFFETNHAVELGGVHIPAGTALFLLTRHGGMQESAFAAATHFQPERWLTGAAGPQSGPQPSAFMPFGGGPRFCPGRNLALLEIKAVMAMLCRNFSLTKADATKPVGEHFAFTMTPRNLLVQVSRRGARTPS
jgi:cytochrome P450/nitrite reductase/ring-hydroxylating ferredoxin subunit